MHPPLEQLQRSLSSAIDGMSAEDFSWHPANKWCAAQILEHLYLSYTGTTKGFQKMLEAGKPLATRGSPRQRFFAFDYLPSGREAPAPTRPKGLPREEVRNGYSQKIAALDAIITQAEDRFGSGTPLLDHPFLGPLIGAQWRKFHLLHGLHHGKQIVRLRRVPHR
jgi:Protein of unknown function (DUF1569)